MWFIRLFFSSILLLYALSVNFGLPHVGVLVSSSLSIRLFYGFSPFSFLFTQKHGDNFILPGCTRGLGATGISALAGVSRSYRRLFRI